MSYCMLTNIFIFHDIVDDLAAMKTSLKSLNVEGQEDLTSQWEGAEKECIKNGQCKSK